MRPTTRPETHQNLIYSDKDHGIHRMPATAASFPTPPNFFFSATRQSKASPGAASPAEPTTRKRHPQMTQMTQMLRTKAHRGGQRAGKQASSFLICVIC